MLSEKHGLKIAQNIILQEIQALQKVKSEIGFELWNTSKVISDCKGLIWVTGVGTSASIGIRFAHILTCSGVRSVFISPADGLHGHSGVFRKGDVLACLSRGGESIDVIEMAKIAKARQAFTISFVNNTESSLGEVSDIVLPIKTLQSNELFGILATTSTIAFAAICDAICAIVGEMRGFSIDTFTEVHPGGAVGNQLRGKS
jgi:arabinose-5-phosphate isomerase